MSETILQVSRYLELVEITENDEVYVRLLRGDRSNTGFVVYLWKWRQWTWEPEEGYQHSESCLFDIVGFLRMLNRERPEGRKP